MRQDSQLKDPDYFVVGLQKSGSYWISALLDAHPDIRCLPTHYMHNITKGATGADEGRIFDMFASLGRDGGEALRFSLANHHGGFFKNIVPLIDGGDGALLEDALKKRYREWFVFHNPEGKPIVGDKTTEYVFHLDLIDRWYPRAKKVCIMRDPKDRVVSWHFHQIRRGRKKEDEPITDEFVVAYIDTQIRREYEALLAYNGFVHLLTYEDLHTAPRDTLAAVVSYLGAPRTTDGILTAMMEAASLEKLRGEDGVYPEGKKAGKETMLTESHYRKGIVGDSENYLTDAQRALIDAHIMPLYQGVFEKYHALR